MSDPPETPAIMNGSRRVCIVFMSFSVSGSMVVLGDGCAVLELGKDEVGEVGRVPDALPDEPKGTELPFGRLADGVSAQDVGVKYDAVDDILVDRLSEVVACVALPTFRAEAAANLHRSKTRHRERSTARTILNSAASPTRPRKPAESP